MSLNTGTKLGPYEIQSPLGAGGMGEVFRARDTRLDRTVAVKILSRSFAADGDRLRRFEQEARTIAALNHPNILAIYDTGTHDGAPYLVSEFLDGETLREAMDAGMIPTRRTIEYALGIAHGLAAAHGKGIIHRDLKPENIFITRDGQVKILDFGLAKLAQAEGVSGSELTVAGSATVPGVVLGTVGYMSPEQVRGEAADARSDIFSFGVVLYEMLTGKRAFKRDTAAETMTAILKAEPAELSGTAWQGPPGLERVVARCLEKNVERRFQSASDLGFAIESLSGSSTAIRLPKGKSTAKASWLPWAVAVAGIALAGVAAWFYGRPAIQSMPKFTRLTYQRGFLTNARFAKDGQTVLYSAQWNNDPLQVYSVRREFPQSVKVDVPSATVLALSSRGDMSVMMNPAAHSNFGSGVLGETPMSGGSPHPIQNDVISADYAPDGRSLALTRESSGKVKLEFPAGKVIYESSGYLDYVRVSPQGDSVGFVEHPVFDDDRGWVSVVDAAGRHKQLTREYESMQGLAWSRTGKEIWFSAVDAGADLQLFAVDPGGKVRQVMTSAQRTRILDIAADGTVLLSSEQQLEQITALEPGTVAGKFIERPGQEWFDVSGLNDISHDGKAILFSEYGAVGGPLYLVAYRKLDGSPPVALGQGARPKFSPDGKMAAAILVTLPPKIVLHPIGMGENRELSVGDVTSLTYVAWFPDGRHLLLNGAAGGGARRSYELDLEGGAPKPLGPEGWTGMAISRDGKRIAGFGSTGETVVFDIETQKTSVVPGIDPQEFLLDWTEDGQSLLVNTATRAQSLIYRVEVATGKRTLLRTVDQADQAGVRDVRVEIARNGETVAYTSERTLSTLYLAEGLR